jgi:hypothetical protein
MKKIKIKLKVLKDDEQKKKQENSEHKTSDKLERIKKNQSK